MSISRRIYTEFAVIVDESVADLKIKVLENLAEWELIPGAFLIYSVLSFGSEPLGVRTLKVGRKFAR